ncbi:hypothetical protein FB451DRAFT_1178890 [Mycena latifolia]|nr:hypothetical protein FB451DRAFT_1178890 [Mycena latifolia]
MSVFLKPLDLDGIGPMGYAKIALNVISAGLYLIDVELHFGISGILTNIAVALGPSKFRVKEPRVKGSIPSEIQTSSIGRTTPDFACDRSEEWLRGRAGAKQRKEKEKEKSKESVRARLNATGAPARPSAYTPRTERAPCTRTHASIRRPPRQTVNTRRSKKRQAPHTHTPRSTHRLRASRAQLRITTAPEKYACGDAPREKKKRHEEGERVRHHAAQRKGGGMKGRGAGGERRAQSLRLPVCAWTETKGRRCMGSAPREREKKDELGTSARAPAAEAESPGARARMRREKSARGRGGCAAASRLRVVCVCARVCLPSRRGVRVHAPVEASSPRLSRATGDGEKKRRRAGEEENKAPPVVGYCGAPHTRRFASSGTSRLRTARHIPAFAPWRRDSPDAARKARLSRAPPQPRGNLARRKENEKTKRKTQQKAQISPTRRLGNLRGRRHAKTAPRRRKKWTPAASSLSQENARKARPEGGAPVRRKEEEGNNGRMNREGTRREENRAKKDGETDAHVHVPLHHPRPAPIVHPCLLPFELRLRHLQPALEREDVLLAGGGEGGEGRGEGGELGVRGGEHPLLLSPPRARRARTPRALIGLSPLRGCSPGRGTNAPILAPRTRGEAQSGERSARMKKDAWMQERTWNRDTAADRLASSSMSGRSFGRSKRVGSSEERRRRHQVGLIWLAARRHSAGGCRFRLRSLGRRFKVQQIPEPEPEVRFRVQRRADFAERVRTRSNAEPDAENRPKFAPVWAETKAVISHSTGLLPLITKAIENNKDNKSLAARISLALKLFGQSSPASKKYNNPKSGNIEDGSLRKICIDNGGEQTFFKGSVTTLRKHIARQKGHYEIYKARCEKLGIEINNSAILQSSSSGGVPSTLDGQVEGLLFAFDGKYWHFCPFRSSHLQSFHSHAPRATLAALLTRGSKTKGLIELYKHVRIQALVRYFKYPVAGFGGCLPIVGRFVSRPVSKSGICNNTMVSAQDFKSEFSWNLLCILILGVHRKGRKDN